MKYQVAWDPAAFRKLVALWRASGEPDSAIRAFDRIERTLSQDAELQGESRADGRRILIEPPIAVVFKARPDLAQVLILDAWMIRERG